ncbi:ABC transporter permease [Streptomyces inhibens]|uniref:ABC transporter permease n=1 Tax=Streptomyces inhibens TaxID=2293571 RepID=UPI001EE7525A|nr:ABC transporter permease [Streptomyces inhibens]UKY51171.1 ABC transporter permease [Streptomyces inhibens]
MSATTWEAAVNEQAKSPAQTTAAGRLLSLGRAELTLIGRNRTALFMSLIIPVTLAYAMKQAVSGMDLAGTGPSVESVLLPATLGYVLIFAVYSHLTGAYVARREELVLKRLRTGELQDLEILAGTALPAALIGLAQCILLVVLGGLFLDIGHPTAPHLLIAGVVTGMVVVIGLAAVASALASSAESAQLAMLPVMVLSLAGSGMVVLPDGIAALLELLPLSSAMELIRAGWTGGAGAGETLKQLLIGLVWIGLAVFAVQRWCRLSPRRRAAPCRSLLPKRP